MQNLKRYFWSYAYCIALHYYATVFLSLDYRQIRFQWNTGDFIHGLISESKMGVYVFHSKQIFIG